jgi:hypothetical protein
MNTEESSGLVICPITDREGEELKFTSLADIDAALAPFLVGSDPELNSDYSVEFSPACIRVSRKRIQSRTSTTSPTSLRRQVKNWSEKSRVKMLERFASLDYSSFNQANSITALITLTYPGDWLSVASSGESVKRHLQMLRKRFERAFGRPFFGLWKMEFQRRGAPHFHILAPIPIGVQFPEWLSRTWADIVDHPDPVEKEKHRLAGTGVDLAKGLNAENAHLISFYFSKHSSAGYGPKEYQNKPPDEWQQQGTVGRYWGYWGLAIATRKISIDRDKALFIARTLRRWQQSKRRVVRTRVWRTNLRTGELYHRSVHRKQKIYTPSQAMRLIPSGVTFAETFARFLKA